MFKNLIINSILNSRRASLIKPFWYTSNNNIIMLSIISNNNLILNTNYNYGGRYSRLCYLLPLVVHTLFLYLGYYIYYNIQIINIYILLIIIILVNIEWPIVIVYEYIYLTNLNIQNNSLSNIAWFIFLEILLFAGFYWLYVNDIIHYSGNIPYNNNIGINILDHVNGNNNTDICLYIILHNLLLLLYVTLILQLIHRYVQL